MKKTYFAVLFLICGTLAGAGPIPILDFAGGNQLGSGADLTEGWRFSVVSPILVTSLGVFDVGANGLANPHEVGWWTAGGMLLAKATVDNLSSPVDSGSGVGRWMFTEITPITLSAGSYVVGAFYPTLDADLYLFQATATTIAGDEFPGDRRQH